VKSSSSGEVGDAVAGRVAIGSSACGLEGGSVRGGCVDKRECDLRSRVFNAGGRVLREETYRVT
jgi:hypothetical protein